MIGNDDYCLTLGLSLMLRTGMVTVSSSCDELAGAEWFWLIWSLILKKLAVKMLVWNSAHSGPLSLHPWSEAHAVEMNLFILGSQHLHPCSPWKAGQHNMWHLSSYCGSKLLTWDWSFAPRRSGIREGAKFLVKLPINLGNIYEVDGRSWRTSMYLQWGKGENPPLTSVQLYYWVQRNNQAYGRNALAFPWPARCEGP